MRATPQELIDDGPMSRFQWGAVVACVLLNMIDGFDVLVMAFTGRSVATEWGLSGAELGLLLSAGLVGMAVGSMFVAPWADRLGRRPVVLGCLALVATGVLLAVFIGTTSSLAMAFTVAAVIGVFVNGCVAGLYALTPTVYGPAVRTTGVGTGLAIGRAGAILAPTLAGALLDGDWTPQHLYLLFGAVFVVTAVLLSLLLPRRGTGPDAVVPSTSQRVEGAAS